MQTIDVKKSSTNHFPLTAFRQQGIAVVKGVLSRGELDVARVALDDLAAKGEAEGRRPEFLWEPHLGNPYWAGLCTHPKILDAVEEILGADLFLLMSGIIAKRPGDGLPVEWHQDNTYWMHIEGKDIVTVWLALDNADRSNGCMQVLAGSHRNAEALQTVPASDGSVLNKRLILSEEERGRAVPIELEAGDISIHDSYLIHGSPPNFSTRRRAGYTIRFGHARSTSFLNGRKGKAVLVRGTEE